MYNINRFIMDTCERELHIIEPRFKNVSRERSTKCLIQFVNYIILCAMQSIKVFPSAREMLILLTRPRVGDASQKDTRSLGAVWQEAVLALVGFERTHYSG